MSKHDTDVDAISAGKFREILGHFCSGVVVITAVHDGRPVGMTCQSFSSLSLDPPLVLFCPGRTSTTWPLLKQSGELAVNILHEDQRIVGEGFARSGTDKFQGVRWRPGANGAPHLDAAVGWIDCSLEQTYMGGDHFIAVARVRQLAIGDERHPLLFFRGRFERLAR